MKTILTLLALCGSLAAATLHDLTFVWMPNAPGEGVTEYRLYEQIGGARELKVTVQATEDTRGTITGVVMDMDRTYYATAYNGLESDPSDAVTVRALPSTPGQFRRITVTVTIE